MATSDRIRTDLWCSKYLAFTFGCALVFGARSVSAASEPVCGDPEAPFETLTIRSGDSVWRTLRATNASKADVGRVMSALKKSIDVDEVRPGRAMRVQIEGDVLRSVEIRPSPMLVVCSERAEKGRYEVRVSTLPVTTSIETVTVRGGRPLQASLSEAGGAPGLAEAVRDLFPSASRLGAEDVLAIVYEKDSVEGEVVGARRILAAALVDEAGRLRRAFAFERENGATGHYDEQGAPVRVAVLMRPVVGAVTSGFGSRAHPVSGRRHSHKGIDFGAPEGSEVRAARAGVVEHVGPLGGLGNLVTIDHGDGTVTRYAHLSWIEPSLEKGTPVRAGVRVGAVGSTGLVTGPHLHFEVLKRGRQINPMRLIKGTNVPQLKDKDLTAFQRQVEQRSAALCGLLAEAGRACNASSTTLAQM